MLRTKAASLLRTLLITLSPRLQLPDTLSRPYDNSFCAGAVSCFTAAMFLSSLPLVEALVPPVAPRRSIRRLATAATRWQRRAAARVCAEQQAPVETSSLSSAGICCKRRCHDAVGGAVLRQFAYCVWPLEASENSGCVCALRRYTAPIVRVLRTWRIVCVRTLSLAATGFIGDLSSSYLSHG